MNSKIMLVICAFLLLAARPAGAARDAALRYNFSSDTTNVYHVEIEERAESGFSTSAGNVIVSTLEAGSNFFRLGFQGGLEIKSGFDRPFPPYYGPNRWGGNAGLSEGSELQFDGRGELLRVSGDYPLALPLGSLLTELIQPLPRGGGRDELEEKSQVADAPHWLGPAPVLFSMQSYGPPYYMNHGSRQKILVAAVTCRTEWKTTADVDDLVTLHKKISVESPAKFQDIAQIAATGEGDLVFDRRRGLFTRIELQCVSHGASPTVSRVNRITLKIRLLAGKERDDVLAPPPPPPVVQKKLEGDELSKIISDLKSDDAEKRRGAISRLGSQEVEAPARELTELVAGQAFADDLGIRQVVAGFLVRYATTNETSVLVKMLKDADDGICQSSAKTLGRLKDECAIEPLIDLLASGARVNQYNQFQNPQFLSDIAAALQTFGTVAEKPVAALLNERNGETRRQACLMLKQIGTAGSIEALQKIVGDPNQQLNQAAADAIRAIKQRQ